MKKYKKLPVVMSNCENTNAVVKNDSTVIILLVLVSQKSSLFVVPHLHPLLTESRCFNKFPLSIVPVHYLESIFFFVELVCYTKTDRISYCYDRGL